MPDETDETQTTTEKTVPYARFQAVVSERNELRSKVSSLEQDLQSHSEKAATADTLAQQLEAEKSARAKERAAWDTERAMIDAGLHDQEGRDVAQLHYGRLGEKERPALGDWLKGLREDPTKAPRSLQPFLGAADQGGGAGAEGSGGAESAARTSHRSTRTGADPEGSRTTSAPLSAGKLREIRERAQRSGDWSEWKRVTNQATAGAQGGQDEGGAGRG